ncbi:unnamed protein product [Vicia faba]|uniref:Uncharacterized protein n=1 Tax=Vicia faba TaxID=3906 RepID=A0AAV0YQB5_VICFA|nr:unnamed protein product [Vicia faba]
MYLLFGVSDILDYILMYLNFTLEQGDLKLRVRVLESERAFQRLATVQKTILNGHGQGQSSLQVVVVLSFLTNIMTLLLLKTVRKQIFWIGFCSNETGDMGYNVEE